MWLLTCDGELFGGKRLWLRPGSTHLLGRTTGRSETGERIRYIDHKSVSRKHLTIQVGPVRPGDSSKLFTRSEIRLIDGSKIGTTLNGRQFSQDSKILDGKEYTIKLGNYEHLFHLKWHPVTISFTSASKKSKGDSLTTYREKLEPADIKIVTDYVSNETTHAIAKRRNTVPGLQALIQGKWLLTDGFADALCEMVESDAPERESFLELDFDGNWPSEERYIVPSGSEPEPRPNEYLLPNPDRVDIFQHFFFVFLAQAQYDSLMPVITTGSGKALLYDVSFGQTKVQDVVDYVKEVAGRKGDDEFRLSQQNGKGGVVVVRLPERAELQKIDFMRSIDIALDQRSVEQSEFLDAILTVDASGLRKELKEAPGSTAPDGHAANRTDSRPESRSRQQRQERAVTVHGSPEPAVEEPQAEEPAPELEQAAAMKRRNRRIVTHSRFKGFDDFDPSQFAAASGSPEPSFVDAEPSQAPSKQSIAGDGPSQTAQTQQGSRKRPPPVEEDEEDPYASMLTGHAELKRRRTEAAARGEKNLFARSFKEVDRVATEKAATKAKKKEKEIDVRAELQARRKKEEDDRIKDEEYLRQALEGVDISELKNLAQIEEMEIPVREPPNRHVNEDGRSDRWDPAWNGRKNFKKFRRQGQGLDDRPRLQRVIVTLEEVPRKGHGIGEEYWLHNSATTTTNRSGKFRNQSQSQSARQSSNRSQQQPNHDEDDATAFRRRLQLSREEDEANAEDIRPEEIAGSDPRDKALQREARVNQAAASQQSQSQTLRTDGTQSKAAGKRPATTQQLVGGPPAKKVKQSRVATAAAPVVNRDEDEDDGLKFRRRRR